MEPLTRAVPVPAAAAAEAASGVGFSEGSVMMADGGGWSMIQSQVDTPTAMSAAKAKPNHKALGADFGAGFIEGLLKLGWIKAALEGKGLA